jgi:hypothetical protein
MPSNSIGLFVTPYCPLSFTSESNSLIWARNLLHTLTEKKAPSFVPLFSNVMKFALDTWRFGHRLRKYGLYSWWSAGCCRRGGTMFLPNVAPPPNENDNVFRHPHENVKSKTFVIFCRPTILVKGISTGFTQFTGSPNYCTSSSSS